MNSLLQHALITAYLSPAVNGPKGPAQGRGFTKRLGSEKKKHLDLDTLAEKV